MGEIEPAVFALNHRAYLDDATEVGRADATRFITFRSAATWHKAALALESHGSIPVYLAAVGGGPNVEFVADLVSVQLNPRGRDPKTQRLLGFSLPMRIFSIEEEGKFEEFSQTHFHVNHEESVLENWLESNADDILDDILEDGKLLIIGTVSITY